jgi:hypothetical protein
VTPLQKIPVESGSRLAAINGDRPPLAVSLTEPRRVRVLLVELGA